KAGQPLEIKYILDLRDFPDSLWADKFIKDFSLIENDQEIGVVVEVMGGVNPAFDYVRRCLEKGKSVVTSNKELVSQKGYELLTTARKHNVNFLFEASVGGGIPVIRPIAQCLAANQIDEIAGILNGTTNFILTKMLREHMDFAEALNLAQSLGYAERNPDADILGFDTCRKICILASLAFGRHVYPCWVRTEGIDQVTLADLEYAAGLGGAVKLIGRARRLPDGKLSVTTQPEIINRENQLSNVEDVFNAILVSGDAIGEVMFYGRGAGKLPTASAVIADIIDCAKHVDKRKMQDWENGVPGMVADYSDDEGEFYMRLETPDTSGAYTVLESTFDDLRIINRKEKTRNELAVVAGSISRRELENRLDKIGAIEPKLTMRIH
ncbi:MAG: homoserine dehydrogenase, partial [Oscillospiraceae bacterium]|nr:homoserine dehydrogenase [Oscillospiraceae bacterium]